MQRFKMAVVISVVLSAVLTKSIMAKEYTVLQKDKKFVYNENNIGAMTINAGDSIVFKNKDSLFHNIFSLSKVNKFNLGPAESGVSKSVKFKKPGIVEIECIFHPKMFFELTVK